jgi:hypothetical protein
MAPVQDLGQLAQLRADPGRVYCIARAFAGHRVALSLGRLQSRRRIVTRAKGRGLEAVGAASGAASGGISNAERGAASSSCLKRRIDRGW